jgi:hypothetical protein
MPGTTVRWGVSGTARMADSVVKGIGDAANSELVAVVSRPAGIS